MSKRIWYFGLIVVGAPLLYGVARLIPYGMMLFFVALFLILKPIVGMRSWLYAAGGGVGAGALYYAYPSWLKGRAEIEWPLLLVILSVVTLGVIWSILNQADRHRNTGAADV